MLSKDDLIEYFHGGELKEYPIYLEVRPLSFQYENSDILDTRPLTLSLSKYVTKGLLTPKKSLEEWASELDIDEYEIFAEGLCEETVRNIKREVSWFKKKFTLVTGLAKAGLEETGPIAVGTKKFALSLAQKQKADIVLFDTAAGTHCSVIQTLLNIDFAYAVTEPTPMGAYDLELILKLLKQLKIPVKIILNQAGLGKKEMLKSILKKFAIKKIAREIPYSEKLVKAYSQGKLLDFVL